MTRSIDITVRSFLACSSNVAIGLFKCVLSSLSLKRREKTESRCGIHLQKIKTEKIIQNLGSSIYFPGRSATAAVHTNVPPRPVTTRHSCLYSTNAPQSTDSRWRKEGPRSSPRRSQCPPDRRWKHLRRPSIQHGIEHRLEKYSIAFSPTLLASVLTTAKRKCDVTISADDVRSAILRPRYRSVPARTPGMPQR